MADDVQEQMGDILSAYGIPELAKDIYPIPVQNPTGDAVESEEMPPATEDKALGESREDGKDDEDDAPMDEGGDGGDDDDEKDGEVDDGNRKKDTNDRENTDESPSKKDDVEGDEETAMDAEDSNQSTNSNSSEATDLKLQPTQDDVAGSQQGVDRPSVQDTPDLGLTQSMASCMGSSASQLSIVKNLLLSSSSKTVMTPVPQGQLLQGQSRGSSPVTPDGAGYTQENPEEPLPPPAVPKELTSVTEFLSFFDRCKEEKDILGMKKAILGKSGCIFGYQCPKLTDEQAAALQMTKETFECPGCEDVFLFKTSLDAHMERKTVLINFSCRWCTGRQKLVFTNRCGFHAHLNRHGVNDEVKEKEEVKMRAVVTPATAIDSFRMYTNITAPPKKISLKVSAPSVPKSTLLTSSVTTQVPKTPSLSTVPISTKVVSAPSLDSSSVDMNGMRLPVSAGHVVNPPKQTTTTVPMQGLSGRTIWDLSQCFGCKKKYDSKDELKRHLKAIYLKSSLQQCPICKMVVNNPCKLAMHAAIHKNVDAIPCPECGAVYRDLQSFLIHESIACMHFMHKPLFKCRFCLKYATSFTGLIRHFEWNHVDVFYKCLSCQLAFRNRESAEEHSMQVHHDIRKEYGLLHKCPFCKSVYTERKLLEDHFETHFKKGEIRIEKFVISCSMCSKPFDMPKSLRYHQTMIHKNSSLKNYSCDICLLTFSDVSFLLNHRIKCAANVKVGVSAVQSVIQTMQTTPSPSVQNQPSVTPPPGSLKTFVCGECGMKFTGGNLQGLRKHMVEMHAARMNTDAVVPSAGSSSTFVSGKPINANQDNSQTQSPPERTLKVERFTKLHCGKCDHASTDRLEFERHIETHKKDEHSQCHECGVSFRIKDSLRKHLFLKHKIKDVDAFHRMCVELVEKAEEEERKKKQEEKEKRRKEQEEQMDTNGPSDGGDNSNSNAEAIEEEEEEEDSLKCKVCKAEFENEKLFTAHIRSHGLAYLKHQLAKSPEKAGRSSEARGSSTSNSEAKVMDREGASPAELKPVASIDASSNDSVADTDESTDDSI